MGSLPESFGCRFVGSRLGVEVTCGAVRALGEALVHLLDLATEVGRFEFLAPDGLVDPTELRHRELGPAEVCGDGRVLELGAGTFDGVGDDLVVVEGQVAMGA